MPAIHQFLSAC